MTSDEYEAQMRRDFPLMKSDGVNTTVEPHEYKGRRYHFGICDHCFFPKKAHPTTKWERARPLDDNRFMNFRHE